MVFHGQAVKHLNHKVFIMNKERATGDVCNSFPTKKINSFYSILRKLIRKNQVNKVYFTNTKMFAKPQNSL